jgi:UDP-MurNAc hydroxylase
MKIQYLGHAGFIVETKQSRILIDPWFYAAFFGSWFPYPNNRSLLETVIKEHFDYLYISHTHEDHFDKKFLLQFVENHKDIEIICPKYRSKALRRKLKEVGFNNIVEVGHRETYATEKIKATIYLDVSHKEDSGILIEGDGTKFLDLNDCNTMLSELPTNVDVLAAQFSGAQWYPNCYDYSPDVMQEKTQAMCNDLLQTLVKKISVTKPKCYIPCAGPACFLDPKLQHFNDGTKTIFPTWDLVKDKFKALCDVNVVKLGVGSKYCDTVEERWSPPTQDNEYCFHIRPKTEMSLNEYSELRKDEWDIGKEVEIKTEGIQKYFAKLSSDNVHILQEYKKFHIETENDVWAVELYKNQATVTEGRKDNMNYNFVVPSYILQAIINKECGWEEALLSMRIKLNRNPDVFDSKLFGLLRYGNEPIQTKQMVKDEKSNEMIEKDGYCFQRYCPHAGEDLSYADIENGVVKCPRHYWKWDLQTGECVAGGSIKLNVKGSGNQDCQKKCDLK